MSRAEFPVPNEVSRVLTPSLIIGFLDSCHL